MSAHSFSIIIFIISNIACEIIAWQCTHYMMLGIVQHSYIKEICQVGYIYKQRDICTIEFFKAHSLYFVIQSFCFQKENIYWTQPVNSFVSLSI